MKKRFANMGLIVLLGLIVTMPAFAAPPPSSEIGVQPRRVLFVDDDAPPGGDGRDWVHAFRYLQDALAEARRPFEGVTEVRVAQGVYKADQGAGFTPGDQHATFLLPDAIKLRGGFRGALVGAGNPNEQVGGSNLSGDLGDPSTYEDNSIHVMTANEAGPETLLERIWISEGTYDSTTDDAGAFYCVGGAPRLENCGFFVNEGFWSGGVILLGSDAVFRHCEFSNNWTIFNGSALVIEQGNPRFEDCRFIGNIAYSEHAGAVLTWQTTARFERCKFYTNWCGNEGGAMWLSGLSEVIECDFINNGAGWGGGAIKGGGRIERCNFINNSSGSEGGAIIGGSLVIDCTFENNWCGWYGGGAVRGDGTFINCLFHGNSAGSLTGGGGAFWAYRDCELINCVFSGNESDRRGGALYVEPGRGVRATNCTFVNNTGIGVEGQAVVGAVRMFNCIVHDNLPGSLNGVVALYSCIEGGWPGVGNISADPLLVNPLGPDGEAGTADDDLRLSRASPCIDAGDNTAVPFDLFDIDGDGDILEFLPFDALGNARIVDAPHIPDTGNPHGGPAVVDMGAFEFLPVDLTLSRRRSTPQASPSP